VLVLAIGTPAVAASDATHPAVLATIPATIQVPAGNEEFLHAHGVGTQNYACLPAGAGVAYQLMTPQATLFDGDEKQIATHFVSPNPLERDAARSTWQYGADSSRAWGMVKPGDASSRSVSTSPDAIAWLLVTVVGTRPGPGGGDALAGTTFIQRVNTLGGVAPSMGCSTSEDIGHVAFVPYSADYIFYRVRK
jgi:hypothetical protein